MAHRLAQHVAERIERPVDLEPGVWGRHPVLIECHRRIAGLDLVVARIKPMFDHLARTGGLIAAQIQARFLLQGQGLAIQVGGLFCHIAERVVAVTAQEPFRIQPADQLTPAIKIAVGDIPVAVDLLHRVADPVVDPAHLRLRGQPVGQGHLVEPDPDLPVRPVVFVAHRPVLTGIRGHRRRRQIIQRGHVHRLGILDHPGAIPHPVIDLFLHITVGIHRHHRLARRIVVGARGQRRQQALLLRFTQRPGRQRLPAAVHQAQLPAQVLRPGLIRAQRRKGVRTGLGNGVPQRVHLVAGLQVQTRRVHHLADAPVVQVVAVLGDLRLRHQGRVPLRIRIEGILPGIVHFLAGQIVDPVVLEPGHHTVRRGLFFQQVRQVVTVGGHPRRSVEQPRGVLTVLQHIAHGVVDQLVDHPSWIGATHQPVTGVVAVLGGLIGRMVSGQLSQPQGRPVVHIAGLTPLVAVRVVVPTHHVAFRVPLPDQPVAPVVDHLAPMAVGVGQRHLISPGVVLEPGA